MSNTPQTTPNQKPQTNAAPTTNPAKTTQEKPVAFNQNQNADRNEGQKAPAGGIANDPQSKDAQRKREEEDRVRAAKKTA